jgi:type II secretory pathway component PulM
VKISARERKLLMVGGTITILVFAFYLMSSLLPNSSELTRTVDSKRAMLLKQKEIISQEDGFKARITQYEQRLNQDRTRLLPGDNPSTAAAALQKVLKDFADQSGVEITSTTTLPDQKIQDILTKITVQLSVNCTLDELVRFLTMVESYEKYLRVEQLYIQQIPTRNRVEIRPQIKVTGYVATATPATKTANKTAGGN